MNKLSCKVLFFRYSPFSSNDDEFRPFYIANCSFSGFLCCNIVLTTKASLKIYLVVQRHKKNIKTLQIQQVIYRLVKHNVLPASRSLLSVYSMYMWLLDLLLSYPDYLFGDY